MTSKSKWVCNRFCEGQNAKVKFKGRVLKKVGEYNYLIRLISTENIMRPVFPPQKQPGWKAFWKTC